MVKSHWELIEVLADPGNSSGTFYAVNSDRSSTLLTDNTFIRTEIQRGEIK